MVWKRRPFKVVLILGNMKKSAGAKSGEQGGWSTTMSDVAAARSLCWLARYLKSSVYFWTRLVYCNMQRYSIQVMRRYASGVAFRRRRAVNNNNDNINNNNNNNMCYVEAKGSTSDADSNTIYGSNSKVTITKSNKT